MMFQFDKSVQLEVSFLAKDLKVLAHATRLKILMMVYASGKEGVSAFQIIETLNLGRTAYDFHIKALKVSRFLNYTRRDQFMLFTLTDKSKKFLKKLSLV